MRILLLGPVELQGPDGSPVLVRGVKRRAILGALALQAGHVVPVGALEEMLWDGDPPPTCRTIVQGHVAQLRRVLDDTVALDTRGPGYVLQASAEQVDVFQARMLASQARNFGDQIGLGLLRQALGLWRGPALADCGATEACTTLAAGLEEERLVILEHLADQLLVRGQGPDAVAQLAEAAHTRPLRESLVRLLMLSLCQAGRHTEAVELFHATRAALARELGLDPGAGLQDALVHALNRSASIEDAMRRGTDMRTGVLVASPTRPRRPASALPRRAGGFVGRAAELAWLGERLDPGPSAAEGGLVLLSGPAGVGKTALALRWAAGSEAAFPDGAHYVDLRGFDVSDPLGTGEALAILLCSLGVSETGVPNSVTDRTRLYRTTLAGRRALVILDNARTAAQVEPLLPTEPGCVAIITSRQRLADLVATQGGAVLPVEPLTDAAGRAVLEAIAGNERLAADPEATSQVVALCEGLPLVLRIAASRLATRPQWPVAALARELADERSRLAALSSHSALGIEAALETTCRVLQQPELRLYRLLGLLPGRLVGSHAAAALAGSEHADAERLLRTLDSSHLVEPSEAEGYYARHDLVRLHARHAAEQLPAAERDAASIRLLSHYLAATAAACLALSSKYQLPLRTADGPVPGGVPGFASADDALAWFRLEEPTMRELVISTLDNHLLGFGCALAENMARLHLYTGRDIAEFEHMCATAVQAADHTGSADQWPTLLTYHCAALGELGRFPEAARQAERAIRATDQIREPAQWLVHCRHLANALIGGGRPREAIPHLEAAVATARAQRGLAIDVGRALGSLAEAWIAAGEPAVGLDLARQGCSEFRHWISAEEQAGRPTHNATYASLNCLVTVATALLDLGLFDEAASQARQTLALCSAESQPRHGQLCRELLGDIHAKRGERHGACIQWRLAATLAEQQGKPSGDYGERVERNCGRAIDDPCAPCRLAIESGSA